MLLSGRVLRENSGRCLIKLNNHGPRYPGLGNLNGTLTTRMTILSGRLTTPRGGDFVVWVIQAEDGEKQLLGDLPTRIVREIS